MQDLIDRQAALDEVRSYYDSEYVVPNPKSIEERIEDLPSAQPKIIYCKDCKWSERYADCGGTPRWWCEEHYEGGFAENDFCSFAERKKR